MKKILKRKTVKIAVKNNYVQLFGFVAGTVILGSAGVIFTNPAIPGWYRLLNKPVFSPPNWIFGPVWTILFILMGFSIYRIYRQDTKNKPVKEAVIIYCLQFFFNLLWSFLFFGLRSPAYGFAGILVLWMTIAATIKSFYQIDKTSAYLLLPYIAWVSFATLLNAAVYILN